MRIKGKLVLAAMVAAAALAGLGSTAASAAPAVHVAPSASAAGSGGGAGGDFTGDGVADILARDAYWGDLLVYQHTGTFNGTGTYYTIHTINSGWGAMRWIGAADMTGDGLADVVSLDSTGVMRIAENDNTNAPRLKPNQVVNTGWNINDLVTVVDYDGDGFDDILARRAGTTSFYVYYNKGGINGYQTLSAPQFVLGGIEADTVRAADVTLDGTPDLVYTHQGGLYTYDFKTGVYLLGTGWNSVDQISLTDVNRDGKPDVLARRLVDGTLQAYTHKGQWNAVEAHSYVFNAPVVVGYNWFANNIIT